ncbi:MAG TPA: serine/threonine-protein kinase [Polyangia bacterium]|nr:serine/threonine-protein kinase [Polyangia bacterium]
MGERDTAPASPDGSTPMQETFGRYRLLGLLGQGGMGRLYIAARRGVQGFVKIVALKRILPHLADSAQLREMFLNEARIAARLEHPNIVATYELGEVEGKYFISMEYLPGEDLSAVIARCQGPQAMPVEIAAALAQQAAQGLQYAHDARDGQGRLIGLVHRDVNPRNIFLTYHGVVKLLDFGMVRNPAGPRSVPGTFKGKYGYCAPEQLEGGRVDRRADVFCLGIVLWESLTGSRLFEAHTDAETIDAVRSRHIDPPSALRPGVPGGLEAIALRALARDPARRFQSAQEMLESLDQFLLERKTQPTATAIGQWMESLFGAERAALKKSISQGDNVEATLQRLKSLDSSVSRRSAAQPRPLWSTSFGLGAPRGEEGAALQRPGPPSSRPAAESIGDGITDSGELVSTRPVSVVAPIQAAPAPPARAPRPTRFVLVASLTAVAGLVAIGGALLRRAGGRPGATEAAAQTTASLDLRSQPAGASIFVDGTPTGLRTPAVLSGLPVGRMITLRLDLAGYAGLSKQTTVSAGEPQRLSFTLAAATGTLRVRGVPARATVLLDGRPIDAAAPFAASVGRHELRALLGQKVLFSKTIDVGPEPQTDLELDADRSDQ